jgi:hypothetical protein
MADHVRKQIRDAAATVLGNLTTTSTRVYPSRVHELQDNELPGLRLYTQNEDIEPMTMGPSLMRNLELVVEACVKKSDTYDDDMDLVCKEVEVALAAAATLSGKCKDVILRRTEIEFDDKGEKPVGVARMTFNVVYMTTRAAPDAAL